MTNGERLILQIRPVSDDDRHKEAVHVDVNDGAGLRGVIGRGDFLNADWIREWNRICKVLVPIAPRADEVETGVLRR